MKVVTNNCLMTQEARMIQNTDLAFVDGDLKALIFACRDLVASGGYRLAADPLAGYLSRPNPFQTIILDKNDGDVPAEDVLRLESLLLKFQGQSGEYEYAAANFSQDYRELDLSIAMSTLQGLHRVLTG